ncbi:type 1 glutamine amidotransferase [Pseudooceanicola sp. GBMRC 2024]|uniref:Type 1 glutamine amidotransferase n=1 Tax=Pseudooceanicola albus TaxID=2692189 RepID=A0A6L7G185_9RHOB|nr:type 1 glutamine amidotransferase [Pseudooceanicola albus]MXN17815.1 type 1 glutamine amidotransferase [Pseudooceanicola albus]
MRILVFQHLPVEHPGTLRELWAEDGHSWDVVELEAGEPIPDLAGYDLLVAMGGPQDLWQKDDLPWMRPEIAAIRTWVVDWKRPYLGICLGHQLLAEALGGTVGPMPRPEVGLAMVEKTPAGAADPVLADLPAQMLTFQWHGAEARDLPQSVTVLAQNPACPTQAIRYGAAAYGFQFHFEITPDTVPDWQKVPAYAASLEQALGGERALGLEQEVAPRLADFRATCTAIHRSFSRLLAAQTA